jgi:uncharacterized protein YidB (DUF937 family)
MGRGTPSMTALLALLAVAGYQHRDKLAELFAGAGRRDGPPDEAGRAGGQASAQAGGGGMPSIGSVLSEGIRDIVDHFRQSGQGETADSWVTHGPNRPVAADQIETAIGRETLDTLARQTGLSRQEIVTRLTRELPDAVDKYTPEGRIPDA